MPEEGEGFLFSLSSSDSSPRGAATAQEGSCLLEMQVMEWRRKMTPQKVGDAAEAEADGCRRQKDELSCGMGRGKEQRWS